MEKIVSKKDLVDKIQELLKDFEIIGPQELLNKGIFYQPVTNAQDLYLGDSFSIEPVKKFFLSPSEYCFKESFVQGRECVEALSLPETKRMIIGVRPCEVRGLVLLDKIFDAEYKDNSYINNRKRSIIVGLSCSRPDKSCFCASMGGSPAETRGMDALLFSAGDDFIVEIVTDKGKAIFGALGKDLSREEREAWESDKKKRKAAIEKKIAAPESLEGAFKSDYWEKVSSACLSCGICTYLCPTCHCFDLVDEERKKLRCYDGCAFVDFTLHTSGENPRPSKKERYRQRVFHKFEYFKKNFGENLCVGCGRCIRHCPVKIDIAEIAANAINHKP